MLCSCFEIKVYRNLRLEGYVSRMMEKWWCLHPLWRGSMWTRYGSIEALLEGARLPHELQWDKAPLLWGNKERSQNVISLVISLGIHRDGSHCKESACNVGDPGSIPGEGNKNPLQYSCLENPMGGGAWWATVHVVTKSRTQLSDFMFTYATSHPRTGLLPASNKQKMAKIMECHSWDLKTNVDH